MKLIVDDLYSLSLGLNDIADKELEISTALKVEQAQKAVREELIPTEKIRQKVLDRYKNKKGEIEEDKRESYNKEIDELMKQEVELNIKGIELKELKGITIKPRTLTFLSSILEQDAK